MADREADPMSRTMGKLHQQYQAVKAITATPCLYSDDEPEGPFAKASLALDRPESC